MERPGAYALGSGGAGDCHTCEIPFVFANDKHDKWSPAEAALSDAMLTFWTNLATSGSPNSPVWSGAAGFLSIGSEGR